MILYDMKGGYTSIIRNFSTNPCKFSCAWLQNATDIRRNLIIWQASISLPDPLRVRQLIYTRSFPNSSLGTHSRKLQLPHRDR